jgi:uncharacterized protein YbaR (Trm112 family)
LSLDAQAISLASRSPFPVPRSPFPVFIELTDHLRCPAAHDETFLVLLPGPVIGRSVRSGTLGCLMCGREFPIIDGIAVFGVGGQADRRTGGPADSAIGADAMMAFLGLTGPGGYVALVGDSARFAPGLVVLLPGVHIVAVNPPEEVVESPAVSLLQSPSLPLKSGSMRGVVLGGDYEDLRWRADAARAVLPGLRVVGQGAPPGLSGDLDLLAAAGGWWVGKRR